MICLSSRSVTLLCLFVFVYLLKLNLIYLLNLNYVFFKLSGLLIILL